MKARFYVAFFLSVGTVQVKAEEVLYESEAYINMCESTKGKFEKIFNGCPVLMNSLSEDELYSSKDPLVKDLLSIKIAMGKSNADKLSKDLVIHRRVFSPVFINKLAELPSRIAEVPLDILGGVAVHWPSGISDYPYSEEASNYWTSESNHYIVSDLETKKDCRILVKSNPSKNWTVRSVKVRTTLACDLPEALNMTVLGRLNIFARSQGIRVNPTEKGL